MRKKLIRSLPEPTSMLCSWERGDWALGRGEEARPGPPGTLPLTAEWQAESGKHPSRSLFTQSGSSLNPCIELFEQSQHKVGFCDEIAVVWTVLEAISTCPNTCQS